MNEHLKAYIKAIEAQNSDALYYGIESYLSYKQSLLIAVLELFKDKNSDEVLKLIQDEVNK